MKKNIYLLRIREELLNTLEDYKWMVNRRLTYGFIVLATSEYEAKQCVMKESSGSNLSRFWESDHHSTCEELTTNRELGTVIACVLGLNK